MCLGQYQTDRQPSEPIGGSGDAKVVPLRAVDTGTEVRTAEAAGPAYTDLRDGRAQRKKVIPAHWRTWEAAREDVRLAAARHGHAAAYHGVRAPALPRADRLVGAGGDLPHRQSAAGLVACSGADVAGAAGRRGRAAV